MTKKIKQFSLTDGTILLGEIVKSFDNYYTLTNVEEINIEFDEDGSSMGYSFHPYLSEVLNPFESEMNLYYNSIVIESFPETPILLNYISLMKEIQKREMQIKKSKEHINTTLH